jgi:hypothetical protein
MTITIATMSLAAATLFAMLGTNARYRHEPAGGDRPRIHRGSTAPFPFSIPSGRTHLDDVRPEPERPDQIRPVAL